MKRYDSFGDPGYTTLMELSRTHEFPDYVKTASREESLSPARLPAGAYADHRDRTFPVHTKAACYLSLLYLLKHAEQVPRFAETLAQIKRAAERHGIAADVQKAAAERVEANKTAEERLPDSAFAVIWNDPDGTKRREYPIHDAASCIKAAAWLCKHQAEFEPRLKAAIASKVLKTAEGLGLPCPREAALRRFALQMPVNVEAVKTAIQTRMLRELPGVVRAGLSGISAELTTNPLTLTDHETVVKLAETLYQCDRIAGLAGLRGDRIPDIEESLFGRPKKAGENFVADACPMATGNLWEISQFNDLSPAIIKDAFGGAVAAEVTTGIHVDPVKMARVATALPRPDALTLEAILRGLGQTPRGEKQAAEASDEELDRLVTAEAYAKMAPLPEVRLTGLTGSRVVSAEF